jgi:hypothetical protein
VQQRRPLWAWAALALLLLAGGIWCLRLGSGTEPWYDDWLWITRRRSDSLLIPHNGHLSIVQLVIYRALFSTTGIDPWTPFRVVLTVLHLGVVALLFVFVRRRCGDVAALGAALVLLVFGPGWQDILMPFQMGWLIPCACAVGALLLLDRRDRLGDVGASVLLGIALGSSGIGVPVLVLVAVDVAFTRRSLRAAPIILVPLLLYAIWWIGWQEDPVQNGRTWSDAVQFTADSAGATLASLLGLTTQAGVIPQGDRPAIGWGRPLVVAAAFLLVWRRPLTPRAYALLLAAGAFWFGTGVERSFISPVESSRYLYVGALLALLLAAEVARGVRLPTRGWVPVIALGVVAASVVANVGFMRKAAADRRADGAQTRAVLAVVDLQPGAFRDDRVIDQLPGYPLVSVKAGEYRAAAKAVGTPADTPQEVTGEPAQAQEAADRQLLEPILLALQRPATRPPAGATPPTAEVGRVTTRRGCVTGGPGRVELVLPPGGFAATAKGGDARLTLRRFAATYGQDPQASFGDGQTVVLSLPPDKAPQAWHLRLDAGAAVTVCGL